MEPEKKKPEKKLPGKTNKFQDRFGDRKKPKDEDVKKDEPNAEDKIQDGTKPDKKGTDKKKPHEEVKAEEEKPVETKPEEKKPEEKKPGKPELKKLPGKTNKFQDRFGDRKKPKDEDVKKDEPNAEDKIQDGTKPDEKGADKKKPHEEVKAEEEKPVETKPEEKKPEEKKPGKPELKKLPGKTNKFQDRFGDRKKPKDEDVKKDEPNAEDKIQDGTKPDEKGADKKKPHEEVKAEEEKPVETKPEEKKPEEKKPGKPELKKLPGKTNKFQDRFGDRKKPKDEDVKKDEPNAEDKIQDGTKPDEKGADKKKPHEEVKAEEEKPVEAKPEEEKPEEKKPGKPELKKLPGKTNKFQDRFGDRKKPKDEDVKKDEPNAEDTKQDSTKPDQKGADEKKPHEDKVKAEEEKPVETKPEEKKPEEKKPGKPELKKLPGKTNKFQDRFGDRKKPKDEDVKKDEPNAEDKIQDGTKPDEKVADKKKPHEEVKAEEEKPVEAKPEEEKPEEKKPGKPELKKVPGKTNKFQDRFGDRKKPKDEDVKKDAPNAEDKIQDGTKPDEKGTDKKKPHEEVKAEGEKPVEAKPEEEKPEEKKPGKPELKKVPGKTNKFQDRFGDRKKPKDEDVKKDAPNAEDKIQDGTKPDEKGTDKKKPHEEVKAEGEKPVEAKPEEEKPEEKKPGKPELKKVPGKTNKFQDRFGDRKKPKDEDVKKDAPNAEDKIQDGTKPDEKGTDKKKPHEEVKAEGEKPVEAKPEEEKPEEKKPGKPELKKVPGKTNKLQDRFGDRKKPKDEDVKKDEPNAEDKKQDSMKPDEKGADVKKPDEIIKAEEEIPVETKPEEKKPEEKKPGKPELKKVPGKTNKFQDRFGDRKKPKDEDVKKDEPNAEDKKQDSMKPDEEGADEKKPDEKIKAEEEIPVETKPEEKKPEEKKPGKPELKKLPGKTNKFQDKFGDRKKPKDEDVKKDEPNAEDKIQDSTKPDEKGTDKKKPEDKVKAEEEKPVETKPEEKKPEEKKPGKPELKKLPGKTNKFQDKFGDRKKPKDEDVKKDESNAEDKKQDGTKPDEKGTDKKIPDDEVKAEEEKPVDTKPGEKKPEEKKPGKPELRKLPGKTNKFEDKFGDRKKPKDEDVKKDEPNVEDENPDGTIPYEKGTDKKKPHEEVKAEEEKPEEAKPEEKKPEEKKPGKPELKKLPGKTNKFQDKFGDRKKPKDEDVKKDEPNVEDENPDGMKPDEKPTDEKKPQEDEVKAEEEKPVDTKPGEKKPEEIKPGKPDLKKLPGKTNKFQDKFGDRKKPKDEDVKKDEPNVEDENPDGTKPDEKATDEKKPLEDEVKAEEEKLVDTKPEEKKTEEKKAGEPELKKLPEKTNKFQDKFGGKKKPKDEDEKIIDDKKAETATTGEKEPEETKPWDKKTDKPEEKDGTPKIDDKPVGKPVADDEVIKPIEEIPVEQPCGQDFTPDDKNPEEKETDEKPADKDDAPKGDDKPKILIVDDEFIKPTEEAPVEEENVDFLLELENTEPEKKEPKAKFEFQPIKPLKGLKAKTIGLENVAKPEQPKEMIVDMPIEEPMLDEGPMFKLDTTKIGKSRVEDAKIPSKDTIEDVPNQQNIATTATEVEEDVTLLELKSVKPKNYKVMESNFFQTATKQPDIDTTDDTTVESQVLPLSHTLQIEKNAPESIEIPIDSRPSPREVAVQMHEQIVKQVQDSLENIPIDTVSTFNIDVQSPTDGKNLEFIIDAAEFKDESPEEMLVLIKEQIALQMRDAGMDISDLNVELKPTDEVEQPDNIDHHIHPEPSPQDAVLQMHDEIIKQVQDALASMPPGNYGTFVIDAESPTDGKNVKFTISPRKFKNKSPQEILKLIKEQIQKQMADAGMDISALTKETGPNEDDVGPEIKEYPVDSAPHPREVAVQMHEQIVKQVQDSLENIPIDTVSTFNIDVQSPTDGRKLEFTIDATGFKDKSPEEMLVLIKEQIARQMRDAGMDISDLNVELKPTDELEEPDNIDHHIHPEPSPQDAVLQMHDEIIKQVQDALESMPPGNYGTFVIDAESPTDGKNVKFTISPRKFKNKSPQEILKLIKEQIQKQMADAGMDISALTKETGPNEDDVGPEIKEYPVDSAPHPREVAVQMHEQIVKQVQDSLENIPIDTVSTFNIDVQSPTDGRKLEFTIDATGFKDKSPEEMLVLIKEQIARQMRDAGMDISDLNVELKPTDELQEPDNIDHHIHPEPSPQDAVLQLHDEIIKQVQDALASMPPGNYGTFVIDAESPTDGKNLKFTISPRKFKNKSPQEILKLIKEQIQKQMADAGMDISALTKETGPNEDDVGPEIKEYPVDSAPHPREVAVQMHEQIVKQVQDSLENIPIDTVSTFNIDVQSPTDGRKLEFTIDATGFKDKSPEEILVLIKEQIARQMRDAGMDISDLNVELKPTDELEEPDNIDHHIHPEPSPQDAVLQMHDEIIKQVQDALESMPPGNYGTFVIDAESPTDGKNVKFIINPRKFKNKSPQEILKLIKEQIQKQMADAGMDISALTKETGTNEDDVGPEIKEYPVDSAPHPREVAVQMHEQIVKQVQDSLENIPIDTVSTFNIDVQSPTDGRKLEFTIDATGFKDKSPEEMLVLIKEQIARQMRDAGMDISDLNVELKPTDELEEPDNIDHHIHPEPSPQDAVLQLHDEIIKQVQDALASMPPGNYGTFVIDAESPTDGKNLKFTISPRKFKNKSPQEILKLIKEQIQKQMADAGMDISALTKETGPNEDDVGPEIKEYPVDSAPHPREVAVQMHEQIVKQVQDSLENIPIDTVSTFNIDVQSPTDGRKLEFTIDATGFKDKSPEEMLVLIKEQIARQMRDAGMDISDLNVELKPTDELEEPHNIDHHIHPEPSPQDAVLQLHDEIIKQVQDALASMPPGNYGTFVIDAESPTDGKNLKFTISPRKFKNKSPQEILKLIKEQIQKQMADAGMDISALTKETGPNEDDVGPEIKEYPVDSAPHPREVAVQMHEQIVKQVQDSLENIPIDNVSTFNIDVQSPTDGRKLEFTIDATGFKDKSPEEILVLIKEQIARQMRDAGMDISSLNIEIRSPDVDRKETLEYTIDSGPSPKEVAMEMHGQIVQQIEESLQNIPVGSIGSFDVDVQSPVDGSKLIFTINASGFDNKSSDEVSILIKEQVAKQMRDAGMDISGLNIQLRPTEGVEEPRAVEFQINAEPSPQEIAVQMHEQIVKQVQDSLENIPADNISAFNIDLQSPTDGRKLKFTIDPTGLKNKSPEEILDVIKVQIAQQMRDAGMDISGLNIQIGSKGDIGEPDGVKSEINLGPSPKEVAMQMHEQIVQQIEDSLENIPVGSIGSFDVDVQSPVDCSTLKFTINASEFGNKSPHETLTDIKEQIARQMRDAGMDISGLNIQLRPTVREPNVVQLQINAEPSPQEIAVQMHEQIVKQVQDSLGNIPADNISAFNIGFQSPTDGRKLKFTIDPTGLKNKSPEEILDVIKVQIAQQMRDAGMDISGLNIQIGSKGDIGEPNVVNYQINLEPTPQEIAVQMHEQIVQQIEDSLENISASSIGSFDVDVQSPVDGSKLKFTINTSGFENKPSDEVLILIKEQVAKQMRDAGMDISDLNIHINSTETGGADYQIDSGPTPKDIALEMHNQIVQQLEDTIATLPPESTGKLNIEVQQPMDGSKINFTIDPKLFVSKSPDEISLIIKEDIARQMRDAGMDISNLNIYIRSKKSPGGPENLPLELQEQIKSQLQQNLSNAPLGNLAGVNIEVFPVDGNSRDTSHSMNIKIDQSSFANKSPEEITSLIHEQIQTQLKEIGMDLSDVNIKVLTTESTSEEGRTHSKTTRHEYQIGGHGKMNFRIDQSSLNGKSSEEIAMIMQDQLKSHIHENRSGVPGGNLAGVNIEVLPVDGRNTTTSMKFNIDQSSFANKPPEELAILMQEQIQKQIQEAGMDLSGVNIKVLCGEDNDSGEVHTETTRYEYKMGEPSTTSFNITQPSAASTEVLQLDDSSKGKQNNKRSSLVSTSQGVEINGGSIT